MRDELSKRDAIREAAIRVVRELARESGWAITYAHSGDFDKALEKMRLCEQLASKLIEMLHGYPDLMYTGLVYGGLAEYVEARVLLSLLRGERVPSPEDLRVHYVPYLQGLGDVIGELRRYVLELARRGDYAKAFELLDVMEALYLELRSLDYPDALMPGVRRKADVARQLVDATKAMLVDLAGREVLAKRLKSVEELLRSR